MPTVEPNKAKQLGSRRAKWDGEICGWSDERCQK